MLDQGPADDLERSHAAEAGLVYVSDCDPGIRRRRNGKGFSYRGPDGKAVSERDLKRIRYLAIPPAWTDVWIASKPNGHLQATGRDARGRKQYRYHDQWREFRDRHKFERVIGFAKRLPELRARVEADMTRRGTPREKVLATLVSLLDKTLIRVGNEEYAAENASYGLTTLRVRHVAITGSELRFEFTGKSGKRWRLPVKDRRIARTIRALQELPGQHLFKYVDDDGNIASIDSADVNAYLRELAGEDVSAKDFRTWAGTVLAAAWLAGIGPFENGTQGKKNLKRAIEAVAARLGNTVTISRKCYVHPDVIECYLEGTFHSSFVVPKKALGIAEGAPVAQVLPEAEQAVLEFLEKRLADKARMPALPKGLAEALTASLSAAGRGENAKRKRSRGKAKT